MTRTSPPPPPLLFFASLLAFALSIAMLAGCCDPPAPRYPQQTIEVGRSYDEQIATTADVTVACLDPGRVHIKGGSGVLVTERRVVTASHVVTCRGETGVYVEFPTGAPVLAHVAILDLEDDVAVLVLSEPVVTLHHAIIGPRPIVGDSVCLSAAVPRRARPCGIVTGYRDPTNSDTKGDTKTGAEIRPGNSGSGVYDDAGRLVGIVTYYRAIADVPLGGGFTSLESHAWVAR